MDIYVIAMLMSYLLALILSRGHSSGGILTQQEVRYLPTFTHGLLALLPLTMVLLFRWDVGVDSIYGLTYHRAYHATLDGENMYNFEWGFQLLSSTLAKLSVPYYWYLFILGAINMIAISYAVQKASISPSLSILVFVLILSYFDSFSALRQSMSQAISLVAVAKWMSYKEPPASSKKQDLNFLITILISSLMHSSALMYILLFILSRRNIGLKNLIIITGLCIIFTPIIQVVFRIVGQLVKGGMYTTVGFGSSYMLISLMVFALCMWKYYDIMALNPRACLLINHAMLTFIMMLNSSALIQPYRIYDALKICYVLTIPYIVKSFKSRTLSYYVALAFLAVTGFFYYNSIYAIDNPIREYHTVFEDWGFYTTLP